MLRIRQGVRVAGAKPQRAPARCGLAAALLGLLLPSSGCVLNREVLWPRYPTGATRQPSAGQAPWPAPREANDESERQPGQLAGQDAPIAAPRSADPRAGRATLSASASPAQVDAPPPRDDNAREFQSVAPESLPTPEAPPVSVVSPATDVETPLIPAPPQVYPIDLTTALRLAEIENPEIAIARQEIAVALAQQTAARVLLLPTLNAGVTYHGHTGNLQRSSGRILSLSEQSLYLGGGARVLAAETLGIPAVSIVSPLTDAIFEPLAARQRVAGARFATAATSNNVLLEVATLHVDLLAAEAALQMLRQVERDAAEVARLTEVFAQTGQGGQSDADRAATELQHRRYQVQQAQEAVAVASARLSQRLHLDPSVRLRTVESQLEPFSLVDLNADVEGLIRVAIDRRPEIAARSAAVAEADVHVRQEVGRPLLPFIWAGFSGGIFGGGSNLVQPFLGNFAGRTDIDVRAIWTFSNLGIGNLGLVKQRQAQRGQAVGEQSRMIAEVRREVAAAMALARANREQIDAAIRGVTTAETGFREDFLRVRNQAEHAHPIELVNSLDLLAEARRTKIEAVRRYDVSQLRLFVSLGSPPPLPGSPSGPLPPAPIAFPPVSPLLMGAATEAPADTSIAHAVTTTPPATERR